MVAFLQINLNSSSACGCSDSDFARDLPDTDGNLPVAMCLTILANMRYSFVMLGSLSEVRIIPWGRDVYGKRTDM